MAPATTERPGCSTGHPDGDGTGTTKREKKDDPSFECNICLDTARDAVVSMCGHLFCWPCLHQWLETRPDRQACPVCKAAIDKDKVIPLYSRGGTNQEDPRLKVPPRPAGQRTELEPGSFRYHFLASFNFREMNQIRVPTRPDDRLEIRLLSKLFAWVVMLLAVYILLH